MRLIPSQPQLFFSKNDPQDPRLGEIIRSSSMDTLLSTANTKCFALMGYPDDEGIKMNGGRPGANEAPKTIRQFLYKMTPPPKYQDQLKNQTTSFFDLGDIEVANEIHNRHNFAEETHTLIQSKRIKTLTFGGGHDYGFSDASAFLKATLSELAPHTLKNKPVVINFDAHLDVRPTNNGFNSGTPFYRLLNQYDSQFEFIEIGLQPQCNSLFHREWALNKGAHLFDLNEVHSTQLQKILTHPLFQKLTPETPVYISFDIDSLSSSEGGGCSQSWATGLKVQECLDFMNQLYRLSDVRGLGIYEVSPPLDHDFKTSKSAALLAYSFLFQGYL